MVLGRAAVVRNGIWLGRAAVVRNGMEARLLARAMRQHRYVGDMPEHMGDVSVDMAGPFFDEATASAPLVETSRHDKHQLVMRLFDYVERESVGLCQVTMFDIMPFLWSFIAVHVDMGMWNERFPFAELFMSILSSLPRRELCRMHGMSALPDMMQRFVRVYALRCAADDMVHKMNPIMLITNDTTERSIIASIRRVFLLRLWAVQQALWVRRSSCMLGRVTGYLWGGASWLAVLERAEP